MTTRYSLGVAFMLVSGLFSPIFAQNAGINTTGTTPNASALFDLNTGNTFSGAGNGKGLLIPNVPLSSSTDASTITSPSTSLLVYVPSGSGLTPAGYYYNSGTSGSPVWTLLVNKGTSGFIETVHTTNLTNNTATGFVQISLPANTTCGGEVDLCISATDGTNYQSSTETIHFAGVSKGGTYTTSVSAVTGSKVQALSTGTLTTTYSIVTGASLITIDLKANTSLTPTTLTVSYTIIEYTGKTITEL